MAGERPEIPWRQLWRAPREPRHPQPGSTSWGFFRVQLKQPSVIQMFCKELLKCILLNPGSSLTQSTSLKRPVSRGCKGRPEAETQVLLLLLLHPHPNLCLTSPSTHRCFGGFDTSASLRQASSSCARVLGGGRGGIAGSWVKGWARGVVRGCPPLPHRWCRLIRSPGDPRADSKGEAFFVLWALNRDEGRESRKKGIGLEKNWKM